MIVRWTTAAAAGAGAAAPSGVAAGTVAVAVIAAGTTGVGSGARRSGPFGLFGPVDVDVAAGAGFLNISGNSFGAIAAQPKRTTNDRAIAIKIRFSIVTGPGPNLQD